LLLFSTSLTNKEQFRTNPMPGNYADTNLAMLYRIDRAGKQVRPALVSLISQTLDSRAKVRRTTLVSHSYSKPVMRVPPILV